MLKYFGADVVEKGMKGKVRDNHKYLLRRDNGKGGYFYIYEDSGLKNVLNFLARFFGVKKDDVNRAYKETNAESLGFKNDDRFAKNLLYYHDNKNMIASKCLNATNRLKNKIAAYKAQFEKKTEEAQAENTDATELEEKAENAVVPEKTKAENKKKDDVKQVGKELIDKRLMLALWKLDRPNEGVEYDRLLNEYNVLKSGMKAKVKDWYSVEHKDDKLVAKKLSDTTFNDIYNGLKKGTFKTSDYGNDSTARERIFNRIAELKGKTYEEIYNMWQNAKRDAEEEQAEKDALKNVQKETEEKAENAVNTESEIEPTETVQAENAQAEAEAEEHENRSNAMMGNQNAKKYGLSDDVYNELLEIAKQSNGDSMAIFAQIAQSKDLREAVKDACTATGKEATDIIDGISEEALNANVQNDKVNEEPEQTGLNETTEREEEVQAEKIEALKDNKFANLVEPKKPEILTGKWNGKVYGNDKYGYRIYVDNKEMKVSKEDVDVLKKYADEKKVFDIKSMVKKVAEKALVDDLMLHDFRRTVDSLVQSGDADHLQIVKQQLETKDLQEVVKTDVFNKKIEADYGDKIEMSGDAIIKPSKSDVRAILEIFQNDKDFRDSIKQKMLDVTENALHEVNKEQLKAAQSDLRNAEQRQADTKTRADKAEEEQVKNPTDATTAVDALQAVKNAKAAEKNAEEAQKKVDELKAAVGATTPSYKPLADTGVVFDRDVVSESGKHYRAGDVTSDFWTYYKKNKADFLAHGYKIAKTSNYSTDGTVKWYVFDFTEGNTEGKTATTATAKPESEKRVKKSLFSQALRELMEVAKKKA